MRVIRDFSNTFELTKAEQKQLIELMYNVPSLDFVKQQFTSEDFQQVKALSALLPSRLQQYLQHFKAHPNDEGAILIKNCPIDATLPKTPVFEAMYQEKASHNSEWLLALLLSAIGEVVAYKEEKNGTYIHNIAPKPGAEVRQENFGSVLLELHTEHGFHPYKQDYIALIGLRADAGKQGLTMASSVMLALTLLDQQTINYLRQPWYVIHVPDSFGYSEKFYSSPMPVIAEKYGHPSICIDFDAMRPLNKMAAMAIERLKRVLENNFIGGVLQPGDMLIVDNHISAHARTAFKPNYEGEDRWLQRISAVRDLTPFQQKLIPGTQTFRSVINEGVFLDLHEVANG